MLRFVHVVALVVDATKSLEQSAASGGQSGGLSHREITLASDVVRGRAGGRVGGWA